MKSITIPKECNGCGACALACPKNCIRMQEDENGFLYPQINAQECVECGLCQKICPVENFQATKEEPTIAYAAIHKDNSIRLESSSGGVFTAIATEILARGGIVFGATFDEKFNVVHHYIDSVDDLYKLRGSKYVQSVIGDSYKKAEDYLKQDKWVLFTGTPCQIGGLHAYLRRNYDKLITQDIICHGVPSPMVWKKYIEKRQNAANGAKPRKIAFRSKNEGWKRFSVSFLFENDTEYLATLDKDPMMKAFLGNLSLRKSCYHCAYKTKARQSDITLADFWGIEKILPEMDDDQGVSLIIVQSQKGIEVLNQVQGNLILKQVDINKAISYNTAMIHSVDEPVLRDAFLETVRQEGFSVAEKRYLRLNFKKRVRRLLSKIKHKFFRRKK